MGEEVRAKERERETVKKKEKERRKKDWELHLLSLFLSEEVGGESEIKRGSVRRQRVVEGEMATAD